MDQGLVVVVVRLEAGLVGARMLNICPLQSSFLFSLFSYSPPPPLSPPLSSDCIWLFYARGRAVLIGFMHETCIVRYIHTLVRCEMEAIDRFRVSCNAVPNMHFYYYPLHVVVLQGCCKD